MFAQVRAYEQHACEMCGVVGSNAGELRMTSTLLTMLPALLPGICSCPRTLSVLIPRFVHSL